MRTITWLVCASLVFFAALVASGEVRADDTVAAAATAAPTGGSAAEATQPARVYRNLSICKPCFRGCGANDTQGRWTSDIDACLRMLNTRTQDARRSASYLHLPPSSVSRYVVTRAVT